MIRTVWLVLLPEFRIEIEIAILVSSAADEGGVDVTQGH
jgi:hypothetical protein